MKDPALLAQELLKKHFPKFGGIRLSCIYNHLSNSTYNASTGVVTSATPVVVSGLMIIFDEFSFTAIQAASNKEEDSAIRKTDRKLIFPALDVPFVPDINDKVVDPDGKTWKILAVSVDPAWAHYELHGRVMG